MRTKDPSFALQDALGKRKQESIRHLSDTPQEPICHVRAESAADVLKAFRSGEFLYVGVTTPSTGVKALHWSPEQAGAYVVHEGQVEMLGRYRWKTKWTKYNAKEGDVLLVRPEACHRLRWLSKQGLAYIFKAPPRPVIGPPGIEVKSAA